MEWSKDMTIRLIELFREKTVLWNFTVVDFKDRNKKHEAWAELAGAMKIDVNDVEKKMRMLIGQFQRELKKGKCTVRPESPYESKWFFFKMLLFLKAKNESSHLTEAGIAHQASNEDSTQLQDNKTRNLQESDGCEMQETTKNVDKKFPSISKINCTKRKVDAMSEDSYAIMEQLSSNVTKRDEFDVFGEYVAHTLRNLKSKSIQINTKFEINNTLYRAETSDHNQQTVLNTPDGSISFDATRFPSNKSLCVEKNHENNFVYCKEEVSID